LSFWALVGDAYRNFFSTHRNYTVVGFGSRWKKATSSVAPDRMLPRSQPWPWAAVKTREKLQHISQKLTVLRAYIFKNKEFNQIQGLHTRYGAEIICLCPKIGSSLHRSQCSEFNEKTGCSGARFMILDHFWNSKIFLLLAILLHFTSRFVAENSENNKNYFSNQRQAHYGRKSCHNSKKKCDF
jgi:hypothetical protein